MNTHKKAAHKNNDRISSGDYPPRPLPSRPHHPHDGGRRLCSGAYHGIQCDYTFIPDFPSPHHMDQSPPGMRHIIYDGIRIPQSRKHDARKIPSGQNHHPPRDDYRRPDELLSQCDDALAHSPAGVHPISGPHRPCLLPHPCCRRHHQNRHCHGRRETTAPNPP